MATTIRNLHGSEIYVTMESLTTGTRYLWAEESMHPYPAYVYRAPETGKAYAVSRTDLEELGRIVYAIAMSTTEYLEAGEEKVYADPDGEGGLCDLGYAYSLWCDRTVCPEANRVDVEL